jgi:hypothetical protein
VAYAPLPKHGRGRNVDFMPSKRQNVASFFVTIEVECGRRNETTISNGQHKKYLLEVTIPQHFRPCSNVFLLFIDFFHDL